MTEKEIATVKVWAASTRIQQLPEEQRYEAAERELGLIAVPCPVCAANCSRGCHNCNEHGFVFALRQDRWGRA